jgi:hypothetical protein
MRLGLTFFSIENTNFFDKIFCRFQIFHITIKCYVLVQSAQTGYPAPAMRALLAFLALTVLLDPT